MEVEKWPRKYSARRKWKICSARCRPASGSGTAPLAVAERVDRPGAAGPRPREKITPYDFKRPERVGKEQMRALQTLHEGFGRNFGAALSGPAAQRSSK